MAKLNFIGNSSNLVNFRCNSSIEELHSWFLDQRIVQIDTETNVTPSIISRNLILLQFGNLDGSEVFVVQWSFLNKDQKSIVKSLLQNNSILKIIHNVSFDYQVLLNEQIVIENVWDTMIMEQCLFPGYDYDLRFFALSAVLLRRYFIDVSKEMQTQFTDNIITDEKLTYAASDVVHLGRLYLDQRQDLIKEDLIQLGEGGYTENEAILAFADMEYFGMGFNPIKWKENIAKAEPIVKEAIEELTIELLNDAFRTKCEKLIANSKVKDDDGKEHTVALPALLTDDTFTVNWGSGVQALKILSIIFPDLTKASTLEVKKYLLENDPLAPKINSKGKPIGPTSKELDVYLNTMSEDKYVLLKLYVNKNFELLENALKSNYKDELISKKLLLPKGTLTINWNSNITKLEVFRWFDPKIENTDADTVDAHLHIPFFRAYKKYNNANSLITKYGESFIEKHVDADGRVRTRYNTILSTGRVSSSSPNVQQIPKNSLPEERQSDYRNCFHPGKPGWKIISADYESQELCVIATLSQDPVFLDALTTGKDLHSVAAEVILENKWKDVTEKDCAYYALDENNLPRKQKCKCKSHKKQRQDVKAINFGLAYGLSPVGLSADLNITLDEAEALFKKYFQKFPRIHNLLDSFGKFGVTNGYIRTVAPFRRKRYFPYWKGTDTAKNLLGQIERASKNTPIQGTSADMVKIALIKMRRWINKNNYRDVIQMFVQVHDEINLIAKNDYAEEAAKVLGQIMRDAATIVLNNDLLKADSEIRDLW